LADFNPYLNQAQPQTDMEAHRRAMQAVTALREIFLNLVKHGKTARLYGENHHLPRRFMEAFSLALRRYLDEFELMVVDIRPDHFAFNEHTVLSEDVGEQVAYGLYSEGVRAIQVEAGCEPREMKSLADLMAVDWLQRGEEDEDLMAAAWRADFQHVHIDVVDRFSEEDELGESYDRDDMGTGREGANDPRKRGGDSLLVPEIQAFLRELESQAEEETELVRMKQDEVQVLLALRDELKEEVADEGGDEELMNLDTASAALLEREVENVNREEDADFTHIGEVIFEVIRIEDDPENARGMGGLLARNVVMLTEIGEFEDAARLVHRVLALMDADLFPQFVGAEALREGYTDLVEQGLAERLIGAIQRAAAPEKIRGSLFTVLAPLPYKAVVNLVRMGAYLEGLSEVRQVFADVVVTLLQHDPEAVLQLLEQTEGNDQVIPLLALSRLESPRSIELCLRRLSSEFDGVREATLRSLRRYQSPNIKSSMVRALADPSQNVRVEALRYLSVYRDAAVLDDLGAHIRQETFGTKGEDEIKAWLIAYGIIGRDKSVTLLRDLALDNIKQKGEPAVLRTMAVRGLHATRSASAKMALREVARAHPSMRGLVQGLMSKR